MMWEALVFAAVSLVLLVLMLWLMREPAAHPAPVSEAPTKAAQPEHRQIEELFPLHCRHFPQMRQVFLRRDEEYLRQRAPGGITQRWRAERRRVALGFLAGLRDDFQRLNRLAREVARLSPRLSQKQEAELFWLGLRFQALYWLVNLRLRFGQVSLGGLTQLTDMIGNLALGIENAMTSLEESSLAHLQERQANFSG